MFNNSEKTETETKQVKIYTTELDAMIKDKLNAISAKSFGNVKPTIISIDEIKNAILEYKQENQIYTEIMMNNCVEIALSFKRILKISNLENLVKLEKLKLDNNMIMKIENLDCLVNLKWLDLSFNQISKIEGLNNLINLTDLSLYYNKISIVEGLDNNRKLNILSIGKNNISDHKKTVEYLRKFSNLQALTISGNPFYKEETNINNINFNQNTNYPTEYDYFLANLEYLKYIDYRPIDFTYKKNVIERLQNSSQKDRTGDYYKKLEEEEKRKIEEKIKLKEANIELISEFISDLQKKEQEVDMEKLYKLPSFKEKYTLLFKDFEQELEKYKNRIFELQIRKNKLIIDKRQELDNSLENFVEKSKNLIHDFKVNFKNFFSTLEKSKQKIVMNFEELDKKLGLTVLREKLYEMEIYLKKEMSTKLKEFYAKVADENNSMMTLTSDLKGTLDEKKKNFKEDMKKINQDHMDRINKLEEHEKNDLEKFLEENSEDIRTDLDKITEFFDDRIGLLKDSIDLARTNAHENFIKENNENEYYRNRKRIQDINQVYDMYAEKMKKNINSINEKFKIANNN